MKSIKTYYKAPGRYQNAFVIIRPDVNPLKVGEDVQAVLFGCDTPLAIGRVVIREVYDRESIPEIYTRLYNDVDPETMAEMLALYSDAKDFEVLVISPHAYNSRDFFKNEQAANEYFESELFNEVIPEQQCLSL